MFFCVCSFLSIKVDSVLTKVTDQTLKLSELSSVLTQHQDTIESFCDEGHTFLCYLMLESVFELFQ